MYYLYDENGRLFSGMTFLPDAAGVVDARIAVEIENNGAAGVVFFDGNPLLHYFDGSAVSPRPQMTASLSGMSIAGLPIPSSLSIEGDIYICDDGVAELSFSAPGAYTVKARSWPYLDKEFTVENPA